MTSFISIVIVLWLFSGIVAWAIEIITFPIRNSFIDYCMVIPCAVIGPVSLIVLHTFGSNKQ